LKKDSSLGVGYGQKQVKIFIQEQAEILSENTRKSHVTSSNFLNDTHQFALNLKRNLKKNKMIVTHSGKFIKSFNPSMMRS